MFGPVCGGKEDLACRLLIQHSCEMKKPPLPVKLPQQPPKAGNANPKRPSPRRPGLDGYLPSMEAVGGWGRARLVSAFIELESKEEVSA